MKEKTPQEIYDEFWKSLVEKNGVVDFEQVKKELFDYHFLLEEVPKVYYEITQGLLSKPNYPADVIIRQLEDKWFDRESVKEDIKVFIEELGNKEDFIRELKQYFDID